MTERLASSDYDQLHHLITAVVLLLLAAYFMHRQDARVRAENERREGEHWWDAENERREGK